MIPRVQIYTDCDGVHIAFEIHHANGHVERVIAHGASQTEAIENLVIRFKQLQSGALEALVENGFIITERSQAAKVLA